VKVVVPLLGINISYKTAADNYFSGFKSKRMKFNLIFFLCYIIFSSSCKSEIKSSETGIDTSITILFKNLSKDNNELKNSTGQVMEYNRPRFIYFIGKNKGYLNPDTIKGNNIKVLNEPLLFIYKFNVVDQLYYIFQPGDSVIIDDKGKFPIISILNRRSQEQDYNYINNLKLRYSDDKGFNSINKFYYPFISLDFKKGDLKNQILRIKSTEYSKAKQILSNEIQILDSIFKLNLISEQVFIFNKKRNFYELQNLRLLSKELDEIEANKILQKDSSNGRFQFIGRDPFINNYVSTFIDKKATKIELSNGFLYDARFTFNQISNSSIFSDYDKSRLLANQLKIISDNFSKEDLIKYSAKLTSITKDSSIENYYKKNYLFNLKNESTVFNTKRLKTKLNDLLNQNKGKIIYIDFWASWCAPCRDAMPASLKLRNLYRDEPISFIYLSIDKNFENWISANKVEKLSNYTSSYLVDQASLSRGFLGSFKINTIPRYIVIDKRGNIYHGNAPGPVSEEIKSIFNKLLLSE